MPSAVYFCIFVHFPFLTSVPQQLFFHCRQFVDKNAWLNLTLLTVLMVVELCHTLCTQEWLWPWRCLGFWLSFSFPWTTSAISFILPCMASVCLPRVLLASYILLQWQDGYCAQGLYHILMEQGYELRAQSIYAAAIKSLFEMTSLAE